MAVDTREKRFSMMTFATHAGMGVTVPLFEADGSVDLDDQQHGLGFYGGIAWDATGQDGLLVQGRLTQSAISGKLVR